MFTATISGEVALAYADRGSIRLLRFVCGVASLLTLRPSAVTAQEPLSWPNRAPYVRLSTGEETILMPVDAARAAQRCLHNLPPEHWGLAWNTHPPDAKHSQQVIKIMADGDDPVWVSFLATPRFWSLLNDQNVASLNQVLEQLGRDLVASGFDDEPKRRVYLERLDEVVFGMGITLDDEFIRSHFTAEGDKEAWLKGREKSADALLSLCHNVTVTQQGGEVSFTYNMLLFNGSIVRRTIRARVAGRWLELLRSETVELRKAGTFSFPILI